MSKRIYVNIMFKPKIWGVYFTSLFTVLGGFVLSLMILSLLIDMVISFFLNIGLFGGLFGYLFYRDNRDEIEHSSKRSGKLKSRISSYSVSEQKIRIST